jgi:hypothetical protein
MTTTLETKKAALEAAKESAAKINVARELDKAESRAIAKAKDLKKAEENNILKAAKVIKDAEKEEKDRLEVVRIKEVKDLISMVKDLRPDKSDSILSDLSKLSKSKDFETYFFYESTFKGKTYFNTSFYDGSVIKTYKENGTVPIQTMNKSAFIKVHLLDFGSVFKDAIILETNKDGLTAKEVFNTFEAAKIGDFADKGYKNSDLNKSKIYTNKLQNTGLNLRNKENRKDLVEANKVAKNKVKEAKIATKNKQPKK